MNTPVRYVTLNSAFRVAWINSGSTPSPITFNILTGSETLVSSYAGVDSGNGHFYADAVVRTPGLYKGDWWSVLSANTYRNTEYILAFPNEVDQPGRYITWDDVVNRFVGFADIADAVQAASHYLSYAEAYIDGRLGSKFSVPFSNDNMTVRDLVIDVVYARSIRGTLNDQYKETWADVNSRIGALLAGEMVMITRSVDVIQLNNALAWSNTKDYHATFSPVLDETLLSPDSGFLTQESNDRGIY